MRMKTNEIQPEQMLHQIDELKERLDRLQNVFHQLKLDALDEKYLTKDYIDAFIDFLQKTAPNEKYMLNELKCMASLLDQNKQPVGVVPEGLNGKQILLAGHQDPIMSDPEKAHSQWTSRLKCRMPMKRMI